MEKRYTIREKIAGALENWIAKRADIYQHSGTSIQITGVRIALPLLGTIHIERQEDI